MQSIKSRRWLIWLVLGVVVLGSGWFMYVLPASAIKGTSTHYSVSLSKADPIKWPSSGRAAIGAKGYGVLATHGHLNAAPTASIAKVLTALAVLKQKPITAGTSGAVITLTSSDVTLYHHYLARDGSVVKVVVGEKLTEYQALEALLVASANNLADSLAIWAFGSIDNYLTYANRLATTYGLIHTHIADASGFSPTTVSTASDLVKLGEIAIANLTISQIVQIRSTYLPITGLIKNTNHLLGVFGVIGLKTGNTDQAGGCLLFAARYDAGSGHMVTIVGVVMGATNLTQAFDQAQALLVSARTNFVYKTLIKGNQSVGYYQPAWSNRVQAVTKKDVKAIVWKGAPVHVTTILEPVNAPVSTGRAVGTASVLVGSTRLATPVIINGSVKPPNWSWRLFRIKP